MTTPDMPDTPTPAAKPERRVDVAPEDIVLGSSGEDDTGGRQKLKRPRSASNTGLQV